MRAMHAWHRSQELTERAWASPQADQHHPCGCRKALTDVIVRLLGATDGAGKEDGARLEELPLEHIHGVMQERVSSHMLEVWTAP